MTLLALIGLIFWIVFQIRFLNILSATYNYITSGKVISFTRSKKKVKKNDNKAVDIPFSDSDDTSDIEFYEEDDEAI